MARTVCHHGASKGRGCEHIGLGHFGRLFEGLDPLYISDETLAALGGPGGLMDTTGAPKDSDIPAAYTFFAQFVDHDITLDTQSALNTDWVQNPDKIPNLRSASLDLDCVYGFGPEASPHLYDGDTEKLLTGNDQNENDLARASDGTALIGDPRNDENIFVSQMQLMFLRLHNKFIDMGMHFEEAQRECRYHYQYIVLHDFLRRVCDEEIYDFAVEQLYRHDFPMLYGPNEHEKLDMPVEFSVAAYRFGHSMVRSSFRVNRRYRDIELFDERFSTIGFTHVPVRLTVDWRYLLDMDGRIRYQKSRKIDEKLATELNNLPFVTDPNPNNRSLAFRNLVRGRSLGLPSGQAVASALADCGYPIDPGVDLKLSQITGWRGLSRDVKEELSEASPLFFYLLRESALGERLGKTGSAILMEVFGGMLRYCSTSYLKDTSWSPSPVISAADHRLTLADIANFVSGS